MKEIPVLYEWQRDLIRCPSQIYYYFKDSKTGKRYCIYLRWRHEDPWSADLVECTSQWDFKNDGWETIAVNDYTHDDYPYLETEVLRIISKRFPNVNFYKNEDKG